MPPKKSTTATPSSTRGRGSGGSARSRGGRASNSRSTPSNNRQVVTIDSDSPGGQDADRTASDEDENMDSDEEEPAKSIPPELITRLLHEFFEKDGTRITKDANEAATKYIDVFVREAIARAAVEKESGFLEVRF
ncbi:centromere X protein [Echria macrotheca]|uniref:Centromere X protein n=1 Tax=Echria macrotheca TaxID=438768 RepID=A0AAJ0BAR8_9PEZI|nr:centromere X protein [Echria macrotheca]